MAETQVDQAQVNPDADTEDIIQIKNMHKWFGDFHVLKNIDLNVRKRDRIY